MSWRGKKEVRALLYPSVTDRDLSRSCHAREMHGLHGLTAYSLPSTRLILSGLEALTSSFIFTTHCPVADRLGFGLLAGGHDEEEEGRRLSRRGQCIGL